MKSDSFYKQVYGMVRKIPPGKVTTYGTIAKILGTTDARSVGHALHANSEPDQTPCHRVVFMDGKLAPGYAFGGPNEQRRKLEMEGVLFTSDGRVDLASCLFTFS